MRNRCRLLIATIAVFNLIPCCSAQDSWADYLRGWQRSRTERRLPWTLLVRKGEQRDAWWRRDDAFSKLMADKELAVEFLEKPQAESLWKAKAWGSEPHWLLLDNSGEHVFEGSGVPKGDELVAGIHSAGALTSWERREAFLREHRDNGEALEAKLGASLLLAGYRYRAFVEENKAKPFRLDSPGKLLLEPEIAADAADSMFAETAETLENLLTLPDGWRLSASRIFQLGLTLRSFDAQASPRMQKVLRLTRDSVLDEWGKHPHHDGGLDTQTLFGPSSLWISCEWVLNRGKFTSLPSIVASPGRIYPDSDFLMFVANEVRNPEDLLEFLSTVPTEAPMGTVSPAQWKVFVQRQACLTGLFARAYLQLGRWDQARLAIQECRHWAGSSWNKITLLSDLDVNPSKQTEPIKPNLGAVVEDQKTRISPPSDILESLRSKPEPDLPPPSSPQPIRMVLWGNPNWSRSWFELSKTEALNAWGPDELQWEASTHEDEATMMRHGWHPPRWAAIHGQTAILATGEVLPDPRFLALQLNSAGQSKLQQLDAFIRRNPFQFDARHDRFELLRPRMPNPVLEKVMAEDATRAWITLDFDRSALWQPDTKLWEHHALRLLPELEETLRRWPSSRRLWRLWLSWLPFHSSPLTTYEFASSMAVFRSKDEWLADLPKEVHLSVAKELKKDRRYGAMRDWFQGAWNVVAKKEDDLIGNRDVIYICLAEALSALHEKESVRDLTRRWDRTDSDTPPQD